LDPLLDPLLTLVVVLFVGEFHIADGDVDLDGDRMTPKALTTMAQALNGGINVFVDHEHTVGKLIGTTVKGEVLGNKVKTVVKLEDPETNPTVASILSKLDTGARLGFSIGGDLTESHIGWDGSAVSMRAGKRRTSNRANGFNRGKNSSARTTYSGHGSSVTSVAWGASGLASGSADTDIIIWQV